MVSDLLFSELLLFGLLWLYIILHGRLSHDIHACHATPEACERPAALPGTHPQAFLCRLRAIRRASSPTAPLSATTHGFCPGTPPRGGHLAPVLPPSPL